VGSQELLENVTFDPGHEHLSDIFEFDSELGFLTTREQVAEGDLAILGFRSIREAVTPDLSREGGMFVANSITELNEMPPSNQSIGIVSKGVGARVHSDGPQAIASIKRRPGEIIDLSACDVCIVELNPDKLVDLRRESDATVHGKLQRMARHGARIVGSKLFGLDKTVDKIHATFGAENEVDGVIYNQAPWAESGQRRQGIPSQQGIQPEFIVIRNSLLPIHIIGSYVFTES